MLIPRVLSAIVMAFLFVYAVFVLEPSGFQMAMTAVVLVAGWEWARLAGISLQIGRIAFAGLIGGFCYAIALYDVYSEILVITPVLWVLALYWVINYPQQKGWQSSATRIAFGVLVLLTTWSAMVVLRDSEQFISWMLLLMGLIWGADSGAYFSGRAFGRKKLAPSVSPGKSWEGVYGGLILTQIGVAIFAWQSGFAIGSWLLLAIIALVTVMTSVLGDLTESLFKRHESLKDSSRLIPGHGGVMDRVDSLTSAAPLFVLMLSTVGWI